MALLHTKCFAVQGCKFHNAHVTGQPGDPRANSHTRIRLPSRPFSFVQPSQRPDETAGCFAVCRVLEAAWCALACRVRVEQTIASPTLRAMMGALQEGSHRDSTPWASRKAATLQAFARPCLTIFAAALLPSSVISLGKPRPQGVRPLTYFRITATHSAAAIRSRSG